MYVSEGEECEGLELGIPRLMHTQGANSQDGLTETAGKTVELDSRDDDDMQEAAVEDELHDAGALGDMDDDEFERLGRSGSKCVGSNGGNCESCEPSGVSGLSGVRDGQREAEDDQEVLTDTEVSGWGIQSPQCGAVRYAILGANGRDHTTVVLPEREESGGLSW